MYQNASRTESLEKNFAVPYLKLGYGKRTLKGEQVSFFVVGEFTE